MPQIAACLESAASKYCSTVAVMNRHPTPLRGSRRLHAIATTSSFLTQIINSSGVYLICKNRDCFHRSLFLAQALSPSWAHKHFTSFLSKKKKMGILTLFPSPMLKQLSLKLNLSHSMSASALKLKKQSWSCRQCLQATHWAVLAGRLSSTSYKSTTRCNSAIITNK